jgi:hypothetical protein
MNCVPIDFGNGVTGFVCGRSRRRKSCASCGRPGTIQCDYPVRRLIGLHLTEKLQTCDRWQCDGCATQISPNMHYCKPHAATGPPKL